MLRVPIVMTVMCYVTSYSFTLSFFASSTPFIGPVAPGTGPVQSAGNFFGRVPPLFWL